MMKFLFPILLLLGNLIYAQDSLKKYSFLDLKTRFNDYYYKDKIYESKSIAKYFLQKAKAEKNKSQIAEGYMLMQFDATFTDALRYIDSVRIYSKSLDKKVYPAKIYLLRGNLYFKFDHLKQALDSYILALRYAKENKNERQIAFTELNIAFLQNYIGKYNEAAKTFRYYLYNTKSLYNEQDQIQQNLIDAYIALDKLDSAKILIQKGIQSSLKKEDRYNYHKYLSLQGYYNVKTKNYKKAVGDLQLCKRYFSTDPSDLNINYTLFVLGKAYAGLYEKDKAVQSFIGIDSNIQKTNNTFPELREVYIYLIDYYKEKNDKEKQLYYIDRFLKIDKKLDEQFQYLSTELPKKYDTPILLQEKEKVIKDLEEKKYFSYAIAVFLFVALMGLIFFVYKVKKSEKKHKEIAQTLIKSINEGKQLNDINEKKSSDIPEDFKTEPTEKSINKTISDDIVNHLLQELENFETNQLFLKKGITLNTLAKDFNTNSTYLSEVINTYKEKNFAAYLNDLRIEHALNKLVKDKRFRSYKLTVIAEELGYNNEQAFSLAFKKKTGTPLSTYLKEIEKTNHS